jgi:hypothetical protein
MVGYESLSIGAALGFAIIEEVPRGGMLLIWA